MLKRYGRGKPIRLFVAGLHGDEWEFTSVRLEQLTPPKTGTLLLIPKISDKKYLSTLDRNYYTTYASHLLDAIISYKPSIYLELHSYAKEHFSSLTLEERLERNGVPAYIEIESEILLGSVSPHIRQDYFSPYDLCVSFEMPKKGSNQSLKVIDHLLTVVKECSGRDSFVRYMKQHYPQQTSKAIKNYLRFYGHLY